MPRSTQESDFSLLRDKNAAEHEGYDAFLTAMKGKLYGEEPLNDAWEWFKVGWADGGYLMSDT